VRESAKKAGRRKALVSDNFPLDVVVLDGKATAVEELDNKYAQTHRDAGGLGACGLIRTITAVLVTATARVCLEVLPMGAKGNESKFFKTAFETVLQNHRATFDLVSYDAGAYSASNAQMVVDAGKHYLLGLKDARKFVYQKAEEVLGKSTNVQAETETVLSKRDNRRRIRRLFLAEAPNGYRSLPSLRTLLRVQSETVGGGAAPELEERYFVSSLPHGRLTPAQWLELVRRHWAVETCHQNLDVSFEEDDRPWITHSAQGMLVLILLRRLAYNLLTLFRAVTLRSEDKRRTPWKTLFSWVAKSLEQATEASVHGLRDREVPAVCS
jgi:hypothetical protein